MRPRKIIIVAFLIFAFLGSAYVALCRYQPPLPESWRRIHVGQPRSEVLAQIPDLLTDLFDMKQLDQAYYSFSSPVFGRVSEYLLVHYDTWRPESARVNEVQVRVLTSRFSLFRNQRPTNRQGLTLRSSEPAPAVIRCACFAAHRLPAYAGR